MGAIYAFSVLYILTTHSTYGLFIIVRILSISIVGGLATLWGPPLGAAILVPAGEFLNAELGDSYPGVQDIVYGAALVAAVIFMPEGIWVKLVEFFRWAKGKFTSSDRTTVGTGAEECAITAGHFSQLELEPIGSGGTAEGDGCILRLQKHS